MDQNRWVRALAVAGSLLGGLGLFFGSLRSVAAAAPAAVTSVPAAAQTWFVNSFPGEGLVGYWKFDQVFDHKTFNATPLTFQTILTGGSSITTGAPTTVTGSLLNGFPDFGALELDGINGAAVVSDNVGLDVPTNSFSIAAWVRRVYTGTHTADLIYDSGTQSGHWYFGFLSDDKLTFTTNGIQDFSSPFAVTDSNWHHVAAVVSGGPTKKLTFYLDGVAAPAISATIANAPSGPKLIGNKNGSGDTPFDGDIDELRLYNRPLSAAEVQRLAAGRGCVATGTSWATAFDDPQCAVQVASSGDQVWLAQGTYSPGTARQASFHLLKDLSLLGGFVGGETSPAQRPAFDPLAPLTALTGDVAGDDLPDTFGNYADNACNVVTTGLNGIPGPAPSVTFDGLAIEDGNARCSFPNSSSGGGLADFSAVHLAFNNVVFQANEANEQGGGLAASGQTSLNAVRFSRNKAGQGGGLAITFGGSVTVTASTFADNTANDGGALEIADPIIAHTAVSIAGTTFSGNQASDSGGALYQQITNGSVDLSISQSTFNGNSNLGGKGGAIDDICPGAGVIRTLVSHSTFSDNVAEEDGGAVSDFACQTTLADSSFTGNRSPNGQGGALEARSVITVTNVTFQNNSALDTGGAASVFGTLVMSGSNVSSNRVVDTALASDFTPVGGGALVSGTAIITNSQFFSNTASVFGLLDNNLADGGGLAVVGSLSLTGGNFQHNSAEHGGGVFVQGSATIEGSLFQGNNAGSGGGVFADGDLLFLTNRVIGNNALETLTNGSSQGGGLLLLQNSFGGRVSNSLFLDNHVGTLDSGGTSSGAAFSIDGSGTLVSNNTIASHSPITASAAVITGTNGLFNNIFAGHAVGIQVLGGTNFEDYNLFSIGTLTVSGSLSSVGHSRVADPGFVAPAQNDYRLWLTSPAIDAGDNSRIQGLVATDLAGNPRLADVVLIPDTGLGSAPIVDIGAFEAAGNISFMPLTTR